jgi:hypothetical protein
MFKLSLRAIPRENRVLIILARVETIEMVDWERGDVESSTDKDPGGGVFYLNLIR